MCVSLPVCQRMCEAQSPARVTPGRTGSLNEKKGVRLVVRNMHLSLAAQLRSQAESRMREEIKEEGTGG